jgi:hypothetical protein
MPYRDGKYVPWKHKIKIKCFLDHSENYGMPAMVKSVATRIYAAIKNRPFLKDFDGIDDLPNIDDIEEFNFWLERFYDYCDVELVCVE